MDKTLRDELIKVGSAAAILLIEWYSMQPYHPPLLAAFWRWVTRTMQGLAAFFGRIALNAEVNYYRAVGSGN